MARRSPQTQAKRRREVLKLEKRQAKDARRRERKAANDSAGSVATRDSDGAIETPADRAESS